MTATPFDITKPPRWRATAQIVNAVNHILKKGDEFEHFGIPLPYTQPLNEQARRLQAWFDQHRVRIPIWSALLKSIFLPSSPQDLVEFIPDGDDRVPPDAPMYVTNREIWHNGGRISEGCAYYIPCWPDHRVVHDVKPANQEAEQVLAYLKEHTGNKHRPGGDHTDMPMSNDPVAAAMKWHHEREKRPHNWTARHPDILRAPYCHYRQSIVLPSVAGDREHLTAGQLAFKAAAESEFQRRKGWEEALLSGGHNVPSPKI